MICNSYELTSIVKGKLLVDFLYNINNISTNSKDIKESCLFIPLIGNKYNGNDFINSIIPKVSLISKNYKYKKEIIKYCLKNKICLIEVKDTLKSLQMLAGYYINKKNIFIIGITGSIGKTSMKNILTKVLSSNYKVISSKGNMNNHIGVPLTILSIKDEDICILEMGMNHKSELSKLVKLARPNIRIITSIGSSHIGNLGSIRNILKAKLEIGKYMKKGDLLIVNATNSYLDKITKYNPLKIKDEDYKVNNNYIYYQNSKYKINTKLSHLYPYIVMSINIAKQLKISNRKTRKSLMNIKLPNSRYQVIKKDNSIIINDAYNASYESMITGINNTIKLYPNKKINLILGDVLELGKYSEYYHRKIGSYLIRKRNNINKIYLVGNNVKYIKELIKDSTIIKKEELIKLLTNNLNREVYYFKASNSIGLEEVVKNIIE